MMKNVRETEESCEVNEGKCEENEESGEVYEEHCEEKRRKL